ncbi:MAG: ribulose-phosphate 3-epimerase [Planctomycetes bacterium]|nr:ribulose-phosphate 3-epimerase [Planctomycetota bacterium]MBU4400410.1 ribulose-phosphate 3-epimerase [Planctomycetota bacterium]MCG2683693.1 ribulose-phosphate 3-epimerase [Planctomycetales bacterium]
MSDSRVAADLLAVAPLIAPSLLACDFAELREEIRRVEAGGARVLHLDIMDGHFVPNLSIGIPVVEAVRRSTDLPLDVHLMISEPGRYIRRFREAGADLLTIHVEAAGDPRPLLEEIRSLGAGAGISLNPPTPVDSLEGCLDLCDLVLVMSVMPGFGGQEFDPAAPDKLRRLRELAGPDVLLSVDGGVSRDTAGTCVEAGADILVTGSALFSENDYGRFIKEVTALAKSRKAIRV